MDLPKVAESNYQAAHALSERLLSSLRVPEGGEARQELEVHLLDGRVVGWDQRLYEVVSGSGPLRTVGPELVEQLSGLLLGFEEGLGSRTVRLHVRAEQRRDQLRVGGWVEEGWIQQPPGPPELDEDFARSYRVIHEETLRRWRVEVKEGAQWAAMVGLEELALWYVGGIVLHGAGVLLELSLPVLRAALARGGAAAAGWLRTVLLRLTPEKRRAFEQLWAKVLLQGETALSATERETLRGVMRHLERLASTPLEDAEKREVEEATRIVDEWFEPWYHRIDDPPGLTYSLLDAEQNALKALQRLASHLP